MVTAIAGVSPHGAARAGRIHGRVDVLRRMVPMDRPATLSSLAASVLPQDTDPSHSVVYLESAPLGAFEQPEPGHATMDQRNETFVPHVLAITTGTRVDFPNDDRIYHNVFSLSKGAKFDLGRYPVGKSKSVRFDRPGIVRVFCEIHSHMSAFILVFAHRYFAVTDDEGRYRLENVPPGSYALTVWNETVRGDAPKRVVTIPEGGGDVDADFTIR